MDQGVIVGQFPISHSHQSIVFASARSMRFLEIRSPFKRVLDLLNKDSNLIPIAARPLGAYGSSTVGPVLILDSARETRLAIRGR
jgi:hypothetical protein